MLEKVFTWLDVGGLMLAGLFFVFMEWRPWRRAPEGCRRGVALIPGPVALPLLGTQWVFLCWGYSFARLHEYMKALNGWYGDVVKEEAFGNVPVVSLYARKDIEKVLKSGGKYPLRPPNEAGAQYRRSRPDRYTTVGLVNEQGEAWYHLRTALTTSLASPRTISTFMSEMAPIVDDWCALLKTLRDADNRIMNLHDVIDRLALELTCALVLGRRMGFLIPDGESATAKELGDAVRDHFLATRDTYFGLPYWKFFPTSAYRRLCESEARVYDMAVELIRTADDATRDSLIFQSVLKADVDEREKIATIVDYMAAGIHTIKNSLIFVLFLVGQDPKIQEKILEDSSKAYLKGCLMESFRMYPTASSLSRILDEEMELGGYILPAGSVVVCHTGIACRKEENFRNAAAFRPERWLTEEKTETLSSGNFLVAPFGAGRRICPGKRYIESVMPQILEQTVAAFQLESEGKLDVQFEFLLTPKGPLTVKFKDRI